MGETYWDLERLGLIPNLLPFPSALNAFIFRHIVENAAATDCVDSGIGFVHRKAVEDYAYTCFREAVRATFGGHR